MLTSLGVGGAERQAVALAERMVARGHAVSLIVLRDRQPHEWPTTLNVVRLDVHKNPASLLGGLAKGRRFLRYFRPELIHSHTYPANMASRLLKISFPTTAVISTVHSVYEGPWPRILAYRLSDFLSRRTTTVSQAGAARYVRLKAVPAHKCSVVTNGIDTVEFVPSSERRACLRAQMGVNEEFVWLAVGRIVPAKDYPNLLRAFSRVHAVIPAARLWVAGEAPATGLMPVQALAAELGVEASVRWLGLRSDMPALLDAADAFVWCDGSREGSGCSGAGDADLDADHAASPQFSGSRGARAHAKAIQLRCQSGRVGITLQGDAGAQSLIRSAHSGISRLG